MKKTLLTFISLISFLSLPVIAQEVPDQYYKPVTSSDLKLRPNTTGSKNNRNNSSGLLSGGCPESINIGGLGEGSRVFGKVEIEVNIDEGVFIDCSG